MVPAFDPTSFRVFVLYAGLALTFGSSTPACITALRLFFDNTLRVTNSRQG
ncbi:hypothetical protein EYZ11_008279 [Aspergillus tanneri]|uniref:Uncharacterized protein n=1 Tax=Aspergillus tanneri TaxID=1220188 RepID=A0A4S3JD03_9EURO|nr:hypothetical protein EYZ11_008279 [Aspergillus tanneri]